MNSNPLLKLNEFGQSIWLDYIRRHLIVSGDLERLIREDALRGVTSNPTIFEKAISGSHDYDDAIRNFSLQGKKAEEIFLALAVEDIRSACDRFRPVYERLEGRDGFVSLEVSPLHARDTLGTIEEARRLWTAVDRPNAMIKIPATEEGIPAIRQLLSEGLNINITLLFGLPRYQEVIEAFLSGIEERMNRRQPVGRIASVASFFLSRIDTLVDPLLEKAMKSNDPDLQQKASRCHGRIAISCAKIAYQIYKETFNDGRFRLLAKAGVRPQRLLWASTSTKNPSYRDTMYVDALIGPDTINTVPMETLDAYRDHGDPAPRLEEGLDEARGVMTSLIELGIDINKVTRKLEEDGIVKFSEPFEKLVRAIDRRRGEILGEGVDRQSVVPGKDEPNFERGMGAIEKQHFAERLWRKDPQLWKSDPESRKTILNGLGWLHVADKMEDHIGELKDFTSELKQDGFTRAVHMGMGGSSLAPLVLGKLFPPAGNGIPVSVLDTTDPATIRNLEKDGPLEKTLFIVASKSGTTAEPLAFGDYFYERLKSIKGVRAGDHFVAITDPGTPLAKIATDRNFRTTFFNFPDIGGRYSALSYFGLLPAALLGIDLQEFLSRAVRMEQACAPSVPPRENPGITLGTLIGSMALAGRNKLTFLMPDSISPLGLWLEQLLAESTGKEGKGILPVAGEPLEELRVYGADRVFICFALDGSTDSALEKRGAALMKAGFPVVRIRMEDRLDIAQEFYRWEIATATSGAVLGINAFDQPNVQESKENTNRLLEAVRKEKRLPDERPALTQGGLSAFGEKMDSDLQGMLRLFFGKAGKRDYVSFQAYLTEADESTDVLQDIRKIILERMHVATTVGYGPRFLHSTGQYHKGGPNSGLFIQLTADDLEDTPIPGRPYSFGVLKRAQALGDFEALRKHGRRVLRIHLGPDVAAGLKTLRGYVEEALR